MKLLLFPSRDGGCLAIEAGSGHRVLCDGGSGAAMDSDVRPWLHKLERRGEGLHLLCATHAGADGLGGIAGLLETALAWRVHDFHAELGDAPAMPAWPRVPRIGALWHNGIDAQIGEAGPAVLDLLAGQARALRASGVPALEAMGRDHARIALALPRAARLSRLCAADMLDMALHAPGAEAEATLALGSLTLTRLGPDPAALAATRAAWRRWPGEPVVRAGTRAIRERYLTAIRAMAEGRLANPLDLRDWEGTSAYLATRTPPLASLMLLAEEDGRAVLLSGDADGTAVLQALREAGRLVDGRLHLHAMTVRAGGRSGASLAPLQALLRAISADHYLVWADGTDGPPPSTWLEPVLAARRGASVQRPFTFWLMGTAASALPPGLASAVAGAARDDALRFEVRPLSQSPTLLPAR
ncbi:hypothetical protein [Paracidovorax citrulli]